jgi:uncharacterized membrane protein YdjX (TVP38/TMEM64 family)
VPRPSSTRAPGPERRAAWLRLGALAAGIACALVVVFTASGFSSQGVREWVDGFGVAAPLVFIVASAALTCALFPGPVLAGASGLLFWTALGFPVSLTAATLGACCAFLISRRVGHAPAELLAGPLMRRIRDWIGRRGFVAVLLARIAPGMPYTAVNYVAGLTPVHLSVFAAATALGAAPRAFAYTALGGSFGDWDSPEAIVAVMVLVVMAVAGLVLLRREVRRPSPAAGSSSPAGPREGPR